ncbi:neuropeptide FF receptor 2-like [Oculina patagonica]
MFSKNSTFESAFNKNISEDVRNNSSQDCPVDDSTVEVVFKSVAYFVILGVSLVGNMLLILIIYKNKQLRKSINYFVFNMAMSDLRFNPLTIMPITIVEIISGSYSWKVDSPWILGNILCKFSYFLPDVSLVVSIESLLLISTDRFVAVVFPLKAKLISSKARFISIGCTWIIAIAVHAHYFYTFRLFTNNDNKTYCLQDWGPTFDQTETHNRYTTATFITFTLVPVCWLAILYGTIAWTLKRKNKKSKQRLSCRQGRRDQQHKKIIRMSVAIIIAFAVCMMQLLVLTFSLIFLWNWQMPPICAFHKTIPFIAIFMLHSWSAVNPCICFIFNKNYWNGFKQIPSSFSGRKSSAE